MKQTRLKFWLKREVLCLVFSILIPFRSVMAITPALCGRELQLPCPSVLKVFEGEVNQGLRDYPLVAGKDTLVRVFVGVEPPALDIETLSLRVDKAELDVKSIDGLVLFTVTDAVIHNPINNTAQQFSENNNVNFYLDGSKLPAGEYRFTVRLFNNGTTPVKEFDFGGPYSFTATKDLRLLFVFPKDLLEKLKLKSLFDDPVDGPYLQHALDTVSRLYPIRRGVGKIATGEFCIGDHTDGLRFFAYPDGLEKAGRDSPEQSAALANFNYKQVIKGPIDCTYNPLGVICLPTSITACEQADKVVGIFRSGDASESNCAPGADGISDYLQGCEGGQGNYNFDGSDAIGADFSIAINPAKPTEGAGKAGMGLAHELGHNFGLVNKDQSNWDTGFHSKNFFIPELSAFHLKLRKSLAPSKITTPPDPKDFQPCPTVPVPNILSAPSSVMHSANNSECVLFETIDWSWLRVKLFSPIIVPTEAMFYVVGTIDQDDTVHKLDSRFWPPGAIAEPPVDSPYNIVFLSENGQVLARSGFSVNFETHVDGTIEVPMPTGAPFSVAQPFPVGGVEVQLRHDDKVIASLRPSVNPPNIALLAPGVGEVFKRSQPEMLIQWSGSDPDGDPLTYTLSFSSDGGQTFLPIGTVFGPETTSYVWSTSFSPRNTKQGVIRVEASDGFSVKTASSAVFEVASVACDIDGNGNIDRNDINAIFAARNTQSTADDLRDADSNGMITVNDARICTLRCIKSQCAP